MGCKYDCETIPFVIDGALDTWPCAQWTLSDWAEQCGEAKFKFRVHRRKNHERVNWENEAVNYVEATVAHLLAHVHGRTVQAETTPGAESSDVNPFEAFPLDAYCFYSGYNYMNMNELSQSRPALCASVRWQDTGLDEPKLANDATNSTLWIGTAGSYTPCHLDTYGVNFVAQLHGRKRWILFPPTDTAKLYPTRIPFEESSIFSQVNFQCINLNRFPLLRHSKPRTVELKAGQILFVPRHWWHLVENVAEAEESAHGISISINSWITGDERENSLAEALVQFLARPLLDAYGEATWLNLNADLFSAHEAARILQELINCCDDIQAEKCTGEKDVEAKRTKILNRRYLEECSFDDVAFFRQNMSQLPEEESPPRRRKIDMKDIVSCILDPEVIDLIMSKLKRCQGAP